MEKTRALLEALGISIEESSAPDGPAPSLPVPPAPAAPPRGAPAPASSAELEPCSRNVGDSTTRVVGRSKRHFRQGPKLTRAQRTAKRNAEYAARDAARIDRMIGEARARGAADSVSPVPIPKRVWVMCWLIMGDLSGRAARFFLERERNRAYAGYVLESALGSGARSWSSLRARRECTHGLMLGALTKYGRVRGKWGGVVMGIPQTAILAALRDPYETRAPYWLPALPWRPKPELRDPALPSRTALSGEHKRGGTRGDVGYFNALEQLGAVKSYQLPAERAEPFEVLGPSGHALNRYDVIAKDSELVANDNARYELLRAAQAIHNACSGWRHARSSRAAALATDYEPPF